MTKSFRDWLTEGEDLYNSTLTEFNALEAQIEALEAQLAAKKAEVNQIAHVIGKPPAEGQRRVTAQLLEAEQATLAASNVVPVGHIARVLSGRGIGARV